MAKLETFTCDVCNKQKGEANHWFRIFVKALGDAVAIVKWKAEPKLLQPEWEEKAQVCGQTHAAEWLSKNFFTEKP